MIFRGINVDYFDPSTTLTDEEDKLFKLWNLEIEKKTILFPGRLTEWKGHEMFLEALNKTNIHLGQRHLCYYFEVMKRFIQKKITKAC